MSIFLENFYIIGFVFLGALILFSNRKKTVPLNSDLSVYDEKIKHLEVEIRTSVTDASKFKALAEERKAEADKLNQDLSKLRNKLDFENEEKTNLSNKVSELIAQSHAERKSSEEKIQILTQFRKDMETKFKELASEALQIQGENFSKSNIEKLEATLLPLKEHVGHFEKELRQVHEETVKDRERLKAEINQLSKKSDQISQNALELSKALKGDSQMQGAWGEMILESILEKSGLRVGEEYEVQAHRKNQDGERLRPDVVVNLPGGKTLVIDSKVSLAAYTDAVNSENEIDTIEAQKRHIVSIRSHINGLSAKGYQFAENSSVDYVILFIPIEGALSEALRMDGRITEYAMEKNITIATPTTLMMALKTISNVWDVERRNKNAELIADRAGKLYDKVSGFILNMEKVGERLTQAQDSYEVAFNQFSKGRGNVLAQVESLKTLGAKTTKSINTEFDKSEEIEKTEKL
ncbi:DNA recombination protein RmuC [Amylibacter sp.]|jgi:DNA recombination protein RmuC|nr:DNA recombination protein RmuC [Amylibacter sp.]MDA9301608.1 DNA recombination protein RmuC [Amylibacter sp.]MDA9313148.1 DNA recombination protein RmuC [Amylibacter sp.]MDB4087564.1 DNA recombination protein RmuC [Amylibacter sp.]MDB4146415.1 DNA recombination protein RmuC [Amylibacter sp.]|tara:strand:+ start:222 stop:1619 length:1398 start_codon:yes stop_codon:yes gene_type:complete